MEYLGRNGQGRGTNRIVKSHLGISSDSIFRKAPLILHLVEHLL